MWMIHAPGIGRPLLGLAWCRAMFAIRSFSSVGVAVETVASSYFYPFFQENMTTRGLARSGNGT
jgi:hypothetical protein